MGIDLAGSERRPTGWAILSNKRFEFGVAHKDEELLALAKKHKVKKVIIDAPLTLPKGRKSIEERSEHHFRECDLSLRKEGIRFFPITLGPMRMLTKRGIALKKKLRKSGIEVFEGFPGASYDRLGVPRKDKRAICRLLKKFGFPSPPGATQDELDALILLLTLFLKTKKLNCDFVGKDGRIVAPAPAI